MRKLAFMLTMPGRNSWNGRWSGDERINAKLMDVGRTKGDEIINGAPYSYNFGDGWVASVDARWVSGSEADRIDERNHGFCGYDWMIDSIIMYGEILNDQQIAARA